MRPDSQSQPQQNDTLLDRLGNFGRSLFGGQSRNDQQEQDSSQPVPQTSQSYNRARQTAGTTSVDLPDGPPADGTTTETYQAPDNSRPAPALPAARDSWSRYAGPNTAPPNGASTAASGSRVSVSDTPIAGDAGTGSSGPSLHERLQSFRHSAFDDGAANSSPGAAIDTPAPADTANTSPGPTLAPPRVTKPASAAAAATPLTARRVTSVPPLPSAAPAGKDVAAVPAADGNGVFARKSPILSFETKGPRRISIGKEAAYEVTMQNSGEVAADEVVVSIALPEWTDVSGAEASAGTTHTAPRGAAAEPLQWSIGRLEAKSREKLVLRLVPRQSRPFDLSVRWDFKAAPSQAMIEVQEPKLALHLEGPSEVYYGKKEVFKLKIANSGTGAADNLMLTLLPVGTGDNRPVTHRMASLAAGEQRTMEVELTARDTGALTIQVQCQADGGAHAELAERVVVRRAALAAEAEGPAVQFVGAAANYRLHVRNPGNAAAKNVKLTVNLPAGAKYVSSSDGGRSSADGKIQWTLDSLDAGMERIFQVKCSLGVAGPSRLEINAAADDELVATAAALTSVEAMADLRMDVKEPDGPVPVGEEAVYQVRVHNRGTKNATDVEVLVYFSQGIEPTAAEGAAHRITPGQITFEPIPSLPAGEDVALTIHARAAAAGNHVFRAEIHCKSLGTRLVSEQTTHFYQDGPAPRPAWQGPPAGNMMPSGEPARTANRPWPPAVPQDGQPGWPPPQSGPMTAPALR